MTDDPALLRRARAGDRAAFEALAGRHRENVRRFVAMMCGDDADDLVQEALARAFAELARFEERAAFSTWLYGIALNVCRHALRDRARHAEAVEPAAIDAKPARHGVLSSLYRRELAARLDQAIGRLPLSMREAFVLRFIENLDYDAIAAVTGTTEGTARVRAHRARTLMRVELGSAVDSFWLEGERGGST